MPPKKRDELKAGVFVIVALALALFVILWLGAGEFFRTAGQEVPFFISETAPGAGVAEGSSIQIGGQEVGQIDSVEYRPDLGRTFYVGRLNRKDITIYADAEATASSSGLVGAAAIAIVSRGSVAAGPADFDHPVEIVGGMAQAIDNLTAVTAVLRQELDAENPESALAQIHGILDSGNKAVQRLAHETDSEIEGSLMWKIRARMDELGVLLPNINKAVESLGGLLSGGEEMFRRVNAGEGTLGAFLNDARLYKNILESVEELRLMLEDLRGAISSWKASGIPLKLK